MGLEGFLLGVTGRILSTLIIDAIHQSSEDARYERMLRDREEQFERQVRARFEQECRREALQHVEQLKDFAKYSLDTLAQLREGEIFIETSTSDRIL